MNIIYSPSAEYFNIEPTKITVKEFIDSAVSYLYGNSINLQKASNLSAPFVGEINTDYRVKDETSFPYIEVFGTVKYHRNNFRTINNGCIRFVAKKESNNGDYSYQDFVAYSSTNGFKAGNTYSFILNEKSNGNQQALTKVSFTPSKNIIDVAEACSVIQSAIDSTFATSVPFKNIKCEVVAPSTIRIRTNIDNTNVISRLSINLDNLDAEQQAFLNAFSSYKNKDGVFSAPTHNTAILSLKEPTSTNNQILFVHKTDGYLYVIMTDDDSAHTFEKKLCQWNWTSEEFTEFELNFDSSLCNFLVNGKIVSAFEPVVINSDSSVSNIERATNPNTDLILVGLYNNIQGDAYGFNSVSLFNKKQHCGEYTIPGEIKAWEANKFYADFNYGQIKVYANKKITINNSGTFKYQMLDGTTPIISADTLTNFTELFKNLEPFESANDLIFRLWFNSADAELNSLELDVGTATPDKDDPYNFEDIFEWVRRECGAPQITCELTDEQIYDALVEAVDTYNKYRHYERNLSIEPVNNETSETSLKRCHTEKEGTYFILPPGISDKDVIDIYFNPRYSSAWFGAGNDFMSNVMAQTWFSRASDMSTNAADYYIYRSSINDISNLIGTQISWKFYNHHLYITPNNLEWLDQVKVGIVYKQPLSIDEIRNSWQIKRYCLGRSMVILGMIRGTFSSGVPIGDMTMQFNSDTLITRGKEMMDEALASMKKEQYPLFMIWN